MSLYIRLLRQSQREADVLETFSTCHDYASGCKVPSTHSLCFAQRRSRDRATGTISRDPVVYK